MPKINGLDLAKKIRQKDKTTRIIILTAHLEQDKLLLAAELNLTKYLPKPISRSEFKTALNLAITQYDELNKKENIIELKDNFIWDKKSKKLSQNNKDIKLTKYEILLLDILTSQKNRTFTIEEIYYHLSCDDLLEQINTTKVKDIIKRIRKKLPQESIVNIYGFGYKFQIVN